MGTLKRLQDIVLRSTAPGDVRPSITAAHVDGIAEAFTRATLLALCNLGINERAVMLAVIGRLEEDVGGKTRVESIWHAATRHLAPEDWLMRIDVVRPRRGYLVIFPSFYTTDTPDELRQPIPKGRYIGSLIVNLTRVAKDVSRGMAKLLAPVESGD